MPGSSWLLPLLAAAWSAAAASDPAATCAAAARSEAEAEGQQECEHAAMRLQALQTGSTLAGARSPGGGSAKPLGPAELDIRAETGYTEGNPYVPGPALYLRELVDEENYWGWCLDITGSPPIPSCAGVQAHSCKTTGEDTQFTYDPATLQIRSFNFNGACQPLYSGSNDVTTWNATTDNTNQGCLSIDGDIVAGATLRIVECANTEQERFTYTAKGQFAVGDGSLCLVLGTEKESLPDMEMRSVEIQSCDSWSTDLSTFDVLKNDHTLLIAPQE